MKIVKKNLYLALFLMLSACGKPADIDSSCSVDGGGDIRCSFHNLGDREGSKCVIVKVVRRTEHYAYGYMSIPSQPICSGLVRGHDVVERSAFGGFERPPHKFCETEGNPYVSWTNQCSVKTEPVEE